MDAWLEWTIALLLLVLVAGPGAAWVGRKHGRSIRGGAGLAMVLLGLGHVIDPPSRHAIEAVEGEEQEGAATGEPKDAPGGS